MTSLYFPDYTLNGTKLLIQSNIDFCAQNFCFLNQFTKKKLQHCHPHRRRRLTLTSFGMCC